MFMAKCFSPSGWKGAARLNQVMAQDVSRKRIGHKVLILCLLFSGLAGFLGAQNWEGGDWDGGTIPIFDDHKSDQRQVYPDMVEYMHHAITIGPLGPMVDGVVIIDAEEITEVILKWNTMHNDKDLNLARAIYADQVDFYDNRLNKSSLISNLQQRFNQRHRNYSQGITQISGRRIGNTRVQIDLYCDHIAANYMRNPHRIILERNRIGWQIISENFLPFGFSDFYVPAGVGSDPQTDAVEGMGYGDEMIVDTTVVDSLDYQSVTKDKNRAWDSKIEEPIVVDSLVIKNSQLGDQLLNNGDFSYADDGWSTVEFTPGALIRFEMVDGNDCIRLGHQNNRDWVAIGQEIRSKLKPGTLYEIRLRYRSDCANVQVPLNIRFGDPNLLMHSSTIAPILNGLFVINDNTWHEVAGYFRAGANMPNASEPMLDIIFDYGSAGSIWLDDVSLREYK